ncbi:cytochrome d ubiquinol oxidase subunit II [bacterium]|nr:MAG: cytochrome d ubiquinol oxidase subunit II [bacterium]
MNYPVDLPTLWFLLVGVLLVGYAILDGFDLGVGILLLRAKEDVDRRVLLNAIGPVWDGNEVWLVVGGGALFAAFPDVYATVFSGFYMPFMLLLVALIFRAVAIEFRSKENSPRWRQTWDVSFAIASVLIALLAGVALGNMVIGIPVDHHFEYQGGFFNLLNPYALIVGITTVSVFAMHGAIYLVMKTEGELQKRVKAWTKSATISFGVCYGVLTMATFVFAPHMADRIRETPALMLFPLVSLLSIANVPREIAAGREVRAFVSSSIGIASLLALFGLGTYPNLVISVPHPEHSLTIRNAAASEATLTTMTTIALVGIPFVLSYTIAIYRIFRGKVDVGHLHY